MVRSTLLLLPLISACIVAVSATVVIDEPVDAVDLTLSNGDVSVEAEPGNVVLEADLGGLSDSDFEYWVDDRVLYVDATCGSARLCGGSIDVTMPPRARLSARVAAGSITVDGLRGELFLGSNTGSVSGTNLRADYANVEVDVGDVDLRFERAPVKVTTVVRSGTVRIRVPKGTYDLQLDGGGSVQTSGITIDPSSPNLIEVEVDAGSIDVIGT